MSNKKGALLCILLCAISFSGAFTGYVAGNSKNNKNNIKSRSSAQIVRASRENNVTAGYLLKEYEGCVSLFIKYTDSSLSLYEKYDTPVSTLPEFDRSRLKSGIEAHSLSEAIELAEGFIE